FIGDVIASGGVSPLVRVDGTSPPPESLHPELPGYRGARPVRFGNAAAGQLQVDVAGEVLELARALAHSDSLPASLASAVTPLAHWLVDSWQVPDHGIWEIRGAAREYTHSRVMAWVGLTSAAEIVEHTEGYVRRDDASLWRRTAEAIRTATTPPGGIPMQLRVDGGGADASLSVAVMNGFLDPGSTTAAATLDLIARDLDDHGMLQRYQGTQDELADPCAPFVFPSFWMASAEAAAGRDSTRRLEAAVSAAGELGLFGEVRDPATGGPLGNYPQVQSHAALIQSLTVLPSLRW
ncbi:MAG: glycoside hydrolase family 15 protein, partial [Candidatus Dormibacteria bacterium]